MGVLCVEFFVTRQGGLVINELAPRPHNSGHLTFDASRVTSQFEQQLRAVCGLARWDRPSCCGRPRWRIYWAIFGSLGHSQLGRRLPLRGSQNYTCMGKETPRPGRKMGHLTALAAIPPKPRPLERSKRGGS